MKLKHLVLSSLAGTFLMTEVHAATEWNVSPVGQTSSIY